MITFILYYLPMIVCLGVMVYASVADREFIPVFVFGMLVISCIPVLNIIAAIYFLDDLS